jgi:CRISPR-associated protein Cas2
MAQRVYLLSYDIRDKRRLREMHKVAKAFGRMLQYSLYACALTRTQRIDLRIRVAAVMDAKVDSVIILDLGAMQDRESWIPPYESLGIVEQLDVRSSIIV